MTLLYTLPYITLRYLTLTVHQIALHFLTLTLHYITLHATSTVGHQPPPQILPIFRASLSGCGRATPGPWEFSMDWLKGKS